MGYASGIIEVTVVPTNVDPIATDDSTNIQQGQTAYIDVLMNDSDADYDMLSVSGVSTPAHGATSVTNYGNTVQYTPDITWYGTDTFTYTVSDGNGGADTATVTISINGNPIAVTDAVSTNKNSSVVISPLVNDTDPDNNTPLSLNYANYPMNGYIMQNGDQITYTPYFNWTGTDTFTYYISDTNMGYASGTIEVTVIPTNADPVAVDDSASIQQGQTAYIDVLMNDSDADYDMLSVSGVSTPAHGATSITNYGSTIEYIPESTLFGTDTFTYTVSDGNGGTDTATVTISINGNPIAVTDAVSTNKNSSVVISPLANDTDPDNNTPLSLNYVNYPMNGYIMQNGDQITYTPYFNWTGTDTFTYYISDSAMGSATGTIEVTVIPTNVDPVATDDSTTIQQGQTTYIEVLMNDSDADYDMLSVSGVSTPVHGATSIINYGNTIQYIPDPTWFGTDTFTYTVSDGNGGTDTATVTISINAAPVAVTDTVSTNKNTSVVISPLANDTDPDNNTPLSLNYVNQPMYGYISQNGNQITYTPYFNWTGTDTFTYYISDTAMGSATGTIGDTNQC